jgi:hypothetical protein
MGTITNIGEYTQRNKLVTPRQLLEMVLADIDKGEIAPTSAILLFVDAGAPDDPDDVLHTYRSNISINQEQCLVGNHLLRLQLERIT